MAFFCYAIKITDVKLNMLRLVHKINFATIFWGKLQMITSDVTKKGEKLCTLK